MKIRALNEPDISNSTTQESSNDEGRQLALSKEASEEQLFEKYQQALVAIQEFRLDEAKELLEELIDEFDDHAGSDSESLSQLRYSVLKNLGNIDKESIEHYIKALNIDSTDISLLIKAGDRSLKFSNFSLARQCYEQALVLNPKNWVAIDKLIELYYILHLPIELLDICSKALSLNSRHKKARVLLDEAKRLQPNFRANESNSSDISSNSNLLPEDKDKISSDLLLPLYEARNKRRSQIRDDFYSIKRTRIGVTLDSSRAQSLAAFGGYIIKVYERFSKQGLTRNTVIDVTLSSSLNSSQQPSGGNCLSNSEAQTTNTSSQDIEMAIDGDGASTSDDKSNNRVDPSVLNDEIDQTKSNSRSKSQNQHSNSKNSSLSFAAMLFPMDSGDKRRSSRNRSNQDDTFSFKMKFDELNELLPECLRIGAIERTLELRREELQKNSENDKGKLEDPISVETNLEPVRENLIIMDIIEALSNKMQSTTALNKNDIKLCDIFYLYLSKVSQKKQNTLPEAFPKLYKIYRRLCPLPNDIYINIGPDGISLDELWFTVTANEVAYNQSECLWLLRILEQLSLYLDDNQYREFQIRLFILLGLNEDHRYLEIALQKMEEDTRVYASNRKIITRAYIKTLIDRANEKLQHENEDADGPLDLINKLAPKSESEMSDREISSLCAAIKTAGVWQRGVDILNQRNDLTSDIIMETLNICIKNGAKMDAILASKLCKDAISGSRPIAWTCLFHGWVGISSEKELEDARTIENMGKFFELGHQSLGKKCTCTSDKGEFLMLYVKHLLEDRENLEERELLGALNCLFGYPNKRPALVATHKAIRVPMLWEYAETIYDYLEPEDLPTYMSLLRKAGITSELEPLFVEIVSTVPTDLDPKQNVQKIVDFIDRGKSIDLPEIMTASDVTKTIYYFLADYYFKNKDFSRAKSFYHLDLVINPNRFDSWAASGLIRASEIDKALSDGSVTSQDFVEGPFHDLVDATVRCFEKATNINPNEANATLWIEFGNLTYNLASLGARLYSYDQFEGELDDSPVSQDYSRIMSRHRHLYELAKYCFLSANTLCISEEIWLHYYMLGKIYEKVDTFKALEFYQKADAQLFHEGASYPKKISYHNPPELAYEAMEVHYRIHSSVLKYLLTTDEVTQTQMNHLKRYLLNSQRSPFVEMEGHTNFKNNADRYIDRDVSLLIEDVVESVFTEAEFDELIYMCLHGMKRCLVRCDKNFKALYRLSFYYQKINNPQMAQDILIVREMTTDRQIRNLLAMKLGIPEYRAAPPDLKGVDSLFKDRKMGNLFFNIWRIPVEEVDRPGCFEHWMFKCTSLLIKICVDLRDTSMLTMIAFQLSKQPETSKKYLQNRPRLLLATYAMKSVIDVVVTAIDSANHYESKRAIAREGMILADRFIKANVFADKMRDLFNVCQKISIPNIPPVSCITID